MRRRASCEASNRGDLEARSILLLEACGRSGLFPKEKYGYPAVLSSPVHPMRGGLLWVLFRLLGLLGDGSYSLCSGAGGRLVELCGTFYC